MQAKVKKTLDQLLTDRVDLSLSFIVPLILKLFAVNKYIKQYYFIYSSNKNNFFMKNMYLSLFD